MSGAGHHDSNADYAARGMASEAVQAVRSHEALDAQWHHNMEQKYEEIKRLIGQTNDKIDQTFRSYDSKFWTLAVSIIFLLVGGVSALLFYMITHPAG